MSNPVPVIVLVDEDDSEVDSVTKAEERCHASTSSGENLKRKRKSSDESVNLQNHEEGRIDFEKEYCPEAVMEYRKLQRDQNGRLGINAQTRKLTLKVKNHLSANGWVLYYFDRKEGRKELRYKSPSGKIFSSLITACEWYLIKQEQDCSLPEVPVLSSSTPQPATVTNPSSSKRDESKDELPARVLPTSERVSSSSGQSSNSFLSRLIDDNIVLPGGKLYYRNKRDGRPLKHGKITREGIKCTCCEEVFSITKFEAHAGSTLHRPAANIFLEDGSRSLSQCQLQLKATENEETNRSEEPQQAKAAPEGQLQSKAENQSPESQQVKGTTPDDQHKNDSICCVCHGDGELLLCDECPSSFHSRCLGLNDIPDGDWFCPSCCCGICGLGRRFMEEKKESTVRCVQCEDEYHIGCLPDDYLPEEEEDGNWLCSSSCEQIHWSLQNLVGRPIPIPVEKEKEKDNVVLTWLKYRGAGEVDINKKLRGAFKILDECFQPMKEESTGRDIKKDVVFSRYSKLPRLNFEGFYVVALERNGELATAATIRVFGNKVAELPFVGTTSRSRRLGMCRVMMDKLQEKLMDLGVEWLVLPATPEMLNTWVNSFGFSKMTDSQRLKFAHCTTLLDFPGSVMCQKLLNKPPSASTSPPPPHFF